MDGQNQPPNPDHNPHPQSNVGFPGEKQDKKSGGFPKWIIAAIGIVIIIAVGGFFAFRLAGNSQDEDNQDSGGSSLGTFGTPSGATNSPSPTSTPEPIEKSEVTIEVLNGTGVAGEAGFLQEELEGLDYEEIEVGNADDQDQTRTTATFDRELSEIYVDEITELLEDLYEDVTTKKGTISGNFKVRIITGTRKDSSSTSTSTDDDSTPTPTATATASPSPSPTP